jgi:predicted metal-dependent phosphoesterase TrpH
MAAERGLNTIAITDHDTMASVPGATDTGRELGLEVISGVELTTNEGNHVLGYFLRRRGGELFDYLAELRVKSLDYMRSVVREMRNRQSIDVTPGDLEERSGGGIPNMSHLLDLLYKRGVLPSPRFDSTEAIEFFGDTDYLVKYFRTFAGRKPFTDTVGAIRMIRGAGGAAVWAHPAYTREIDEGYIASLQRDGLAGLEVVTPKHDEAARQRLNQICDRLGLLATGGTDFHGRYFETLEKGRELGCCGVSQETLELLRGAVQQLRQTG